MTNNCIYEICIEGGPHSHWQTWFEGVELLSIQTENAVPERTMLVVSGNDPTILFGILAQIGALNLQLISVEMRQIP